MSMATLPPPMITACRGTRISSPSATLRSSSTARSTPSASLPWMRVERPIHRPTAISTASNCCRSSSICRSTPMRVLYWILTPSEVMTSTSRSSIVRRHAVIGDAVAGHAAGLTHGLIDLDLMALLGQVEGGGEAGRPGADDGDALAGASAGLALGGDLLDALVRDLVHA